MPLASAVASWKLSAAPVDEAKNTNSTAPHRQHPVPEKVNADDDALVLGHGHHTAKRLPVGITEILWMTT